MADDQAGTGDGEDKDKAGTDAFDPKSLSPEAQEYIRKAVQSESDSKSALVEKKLRDDQAATSRQAIETAEQNELTRLAQAGDHEALGQRVAARLNQRSVEEAGIARASDFIEKQIGDEFSEVLGPERVEQIRQQVVKDGGAHAEFAKGLADAAGGQSQAETIQAEVRAALIEAKVIKRDEAGGSDKITPAGQGNPPSTFEEIEQAFNDGLVSRDTYKAAKEARGKGQ